jgi:acetyl-CoA carboxylase biotin carboxyl carrier protein
VPEPPASGSRGSARTPDERSADHAAIERLDSELLPALIAKLSASGLGEIEVREGGWRVRLRRPTSVAAAPGTSSGGAGASSGSHGRERASRPTRHASATAGQPSESRSLATSPAVGIYRPRPGLTTGDRVRTGDRLGAVDMLGVAQDVVSPADGIIGASLAEAGDAVEYGQPLLSIELVAPTPGKTTGTGG